MAGLSNILKFARKLIVVKIFICIEIFSIQYFLSRSNCALELEIEQNRYELMRKYLAKRRALPRVI